MSVIPAVEAHAQPEETVPQAQPATSPGATGSVMVGENDILLEPGVMWTPPADGEVGAQALADCPAGWLCGWTGVDYEGGRMAVQQGAYVHFLNWYWDAADPRRVRECADPSCSNLGPGDWRGITNSISSVYNNTWSITWAPFYSPRNNANYYALRGAPARYVGAQWNDSFTEMCGCP